MESRPTSSPWGKIQSCKKVIAGVYSVSSAGHGGVMVHRSLVARLSDYAQSHGIASGEYLGFEEDCNWALPAVELGLYPEHLKAALSTLCAWHVEYASRPEVMSQLDPEQIEILERRKLDRVEELKRDDLVKQKSAELVVAASALNALADYIRVFRIRPDNSGASLLKELERIGSVLNQDQILESYEGSYKLTAVWTADDKIHIVDAYDNDGRIVKKLDACGNLIFTSR
jgi:hypothetical protein